MKDFKYLLEELTERTLQTIKEISPAIWKSVRKKIEEGKLSGISEALFVADFLKLQTPEGISNLAARTAYSIALLYHSAARLGEIFYVLSLYDQHLLVKKDKNSNSQSVLSRFMHGLVGDHNQDTVNTFIMFFKHSKTIPLSLEEAWSSITKLIG